MTPSLLHGCIPLLAICSASPAQDDRTPVPSPEVEIESDVAEEISEEEKRESHPLGWLSDPREPPDTMLEALVSGKVHLDNRLRVEYADTTGRESSTAITNRLRLGYETKPFHGFSGYLEVENVATPNDDNYFVPATGDGTPGRTVIADPPGTELNQGFVRYMAESLGGSPVSLDLKAGRQRIILDDARFIGNVGWRQFEQTYDSVSVRSNLGVDRLRAFYAYVWGVQRIFGPDGPTPDSDSHLINLSYKVGEELQITPFAYLLDFEDDDPLNSSDSFGFRLSGDLWRETGDDVDFFADYEFTYAHQVDAGANPVDYEADFIAAQVRLTRKQLGSLLVGYQLLGSDDGDFGFRFPLGTNHKFQGFADNFLTTPAVGLENLYFGIATELPWGIKTSVTYHRFWSDEGNDDLGEEIDIAARKQFSPHWSGLLKAAYFNGDSGQPETTRLWAQTTFTF